MIPFKLKPNSNQELFNTIWNHFIKNRHSPGFADGVCVTYDPDRPHARCALGCLVAPRVLASYLREKVQGAGGEENLVFEDGVTEDGKLTDTAFIREQAMKQGLNRSLCAQLQAAHDISAERQQQRGVSFRSEMEKHLRQLAKRFRLTIPELQAA